MDEIKSSHVFTSILADFYSAVVNMFSILPLIFTSPNLFSKLLGTISRVPTTICINVTLLVPKPSQLFGKIFLLVYLFLFFILICPVSWGCRIHRLHLCREVSPTPEIRVLDMTLNNLMVKFQRCWSFGESGTPVHWHCS